MVPKSRGILFECYYETWLYTFKKSKYRPPRRKGLVLHICWALDEIINGEVEVVRAILHLSQF